MSKDERREERKERRAERASERAERLQVLLAAMGDGVRDLGPLHKLIEAIEAGLQGAPAPGPLGQAEAALTQLGLDDDDLPLGAGQRAGTLRLALAVNAEIGKRLPLDTLLGLLPGIPGGLAEKGLLLPVALGLVSAYRLRTDPIALKRRVERLRRKRARLLAEQD